MSTKTTAGELMNEVNALTRERDQMLNKVTELLDERDELRAEVENLKQAIEQTWRPEVNALRAEVERLKTLEAWYTEAIDALHADVDEARAKVTTLEWQLSEATKEVERLRELHDRHCAFKDCRERTTPHTSIAY